MAEQNDFQNWEGDKISDFIVETHHAYIRSIIPTIQKNLKEITENHTSEVKNAKEIVATFDELAKSLIEHLDGEEKYLFPFVKKMLQARKDGTKIPKPGFGNLDGPLKHHVEDHDHATTLMKKINTLCNGYSVPANANNVVATVFQEFDKFEKDLEKHIHLENEVLFDKARELEKLTIES